MSAGRMRALQAVIGLLLVGASLGFYLSRGAVPIASIPAPQGGERVELLGPTRWQKLTGGNADMPGAARLVAADGAIVSTSPGIELSGQGEVFWTETGVQIGTSAIYDRTADAWTVTQ